MGPIKLCYCMYDQYKQSSSVESIDLFLKISIPHDNYQSV